MSTYVQQGVLPRDPFHMLDRDGVGRACFSWGPRGAGSTTWRLRYRSAESTAANPESIEFLSRSGVRLCFLLTFSCSVARLAAAQLASQTR